MKINRLVEITIVLLNRRSVTARELSERFEVSTRTIYRDVDALAAAGVPVYANRGVGGGIALLEQFSINRALFSEKKRESLLIALQSMQVTRYPGLKALSDKLGALFHGDDDDWVEIDATSWGTCPEGRERLDQLKKAILGQRVIEFEYISSAGTHTQRQLEPFKLLYKSGAWYLWGWDLHRADCRTFRLARIRGLRLTGESFDRSRIRASGPVRSRTADKPSIRLSLRFTADALYRLYDDFGDDVEQDDEGYYRVTVEYPEDESVYGYLLSFGPSLEVLGPAHIRALLRERIGTMERIYRTN